MAPIPTVQRSGSSGASGSGGPSPHPPPPAPRGHHSAVRGARTAHHHGAHGGAKPRAGHRLGGSGSSELVCRVKYNNSLPDIPFDPKFLAYPFESQRFISYAPTQLERNYKYDLLTEHDLGVNVDLILPEIYERPEGSEEDPPALDPKDEHLLEEDILDKTDIKRSQRHAILLSWMRKPDYISTEQTRYQPTTIEKVESKIGFTAQKKMATDGPLYMDREAQIAAIEKTFEDATVPIEEHYSKPGVYAVEQYAVLPDDKLWKYPCAQVIFDSDPAPGGDSTNSTAAQNEMMAQAMIRGVMDESGEQFVAYFLPTQETMEKRAEDMTLGRDYDDEAQYEYKMFREYNWNVKSKANKGYEENYFFVLREDGMFYNELETRVRLSKRRLKAGQQASNSKLVVRNRPLTKQETKMQRYREKMLEVQVGEEISEDDEDEDDEEEEEQEQDQELEQEQEDDEES